jgi:hypothetical protein
MNTMTDMTDRAFEIIHEITGNITGMLCLKCLIKKASVSHEMGNLTLGAASRGDLCAHEKGD